VATRRRTGLNHLSQCLRHWIPARDNQASGPGDKPFSLVQNYAERAKTFIGEAVFKRLLSPTISFLPTKIESCLSVLGDFCGASSYNRTGCYQVVQYMNDPNSIIDARSASPLAPDLVSHEGLWNLVSALSPCNQKYTMRSDILILDCIVSWFRTSKGVFKRLFFPWTCARRTTEHLHPCCSRHTSLRTLDIPDKVQHQLRPPKLRIPIPCYTSYNTISPSYTPHPGVMTTLALQTSLILVVGFHAVCRCTISGVQANSETRVPGITMTVRVDIFTKTVTSNLQTTRPKCPNQICDSHPDWIEQTTNVHLIPPLTINMDTSKQTRSVKIQTNHFPL